MDPSQAQEDKANDVHSLENGDDSVDSQDFAAPTYGGSDRQGHSRRPKS